MAAGAEKNDNQTNQDTMLIREVTDVIERFAPLAWQESYDNAGLIVGRPDDEVHRALLAVDVTDEVMAEAEREGVRHGHHAPSDRFPCAQALHLRQTRCSAASNGLSAAALRLCVPHQPGQRPRG